MSIDTHLCRIFERSPEFSRREHGLALALVIRMGKYAVAWLLGVPLSVLVVIYLVSHTVCG